MPGKEHPGIRQYLVCWQYSPGLSTQGVGSIAQWLSTQGAGSMAQGLSTCLACLKTPIQVPATHTHKYTFIHSLSAWHVVNVQETFVELLDRLVHTYNLNTREAKAGGSHSTWATSQNLSPENKGE